MTPRKTLGQLAAEADAAAIAGKPADVCPYCGAAMYATGTRDHTSVIFRYLICRCCGRKFQSKQMPAVLTREIHPSSSGQ